MGIVDKIAFIELTSRQLNNRKSPMNKSENNPLFYSKSSEQINCRIQYFSLPL